jgi:hypothetical protein
MDKLKEPSPPARQADGRAFVSKEEENEEKKREKRKNK